MIYRLPSCKLFYLLIILTLSSIHIYAQGFYIVDAYSNIYKSTAGTTCTNTKIISCAANVGDIAYYKDTLYIVANTNLYRSIVSKPNVACTLIASFNTFINSLTVDSTGTVYAAGGQAIYTYTSTTGKTKLLGNLPDGYSPGGDLTFYNGKLYLAALLNYNPNSTCLVEVNIANPALSFIYMKLKSTNVYGCITLPKQCGTNGFYITGQDNTSAFLTEVDMVNKIELNRICSYDFTIYGAASFTEGGTSSKPNIDSIVNQPACSNEAGNGSISIFTSASGNLLTYTLNGSASNQTGIFPNLKPGTYNISVAGESSCVIDTIVTISVNNFNGNTINVNAIQPTCANNNGKIALQSVIAGMAVKYALNNGPFLSIDTFRNLAAGAYLVTAMNGNGCTVQKNVTLILPALDTSGSSIRIYGAACTSNNGAIQVFIPNAVKPVTFLLNDTLQSGAGFFQKLVPSTYHLSIKDANGCRLDTTIVLSATAAVKPSTAITKIPSSCPDASDGAINLAITGSAGPYSVSINNGAFTARYSYVNLAPGSYAFKIQDKNECIADSFSTQLLMSGNAACSAIYFPNAFTPGKNGKNDLFKPVVYGVLEKYQLAIYNRLGQKVFQTHDPQNGWDGTLQGIAQSTSAFVWLCEYKFSGAAQEKKVLKGTFVLIR